MYADGILPPEPTSVAHPGQCAFAWPVRQFCRRDAGGTLASYGEMLRFWPSETVTTRLFSESSVACPLYQLTLATAPP